MSQLVVNPTFDGYGQKIFETSWADARDAAESEDIDKTGGQLLVRGETGIHCARVSLTFNLSTIPADTTITSATLMVNVETRGCADAAHCTVHLVESTQASASDLVAADYNNYGTTNFATALDMSETGNKTFTFNEDGITYLQSKIGSYAMFYLRNKKDFDNTAPTGQGYIFLTASEATGANIPKLTINYGTSAMGAFLNFL